MIVTLDLAPDIAEELTRDSAVRKRAEKMIEDAFANKPVSAPITTGTWAGQSNNDLTGLSEETDAEVADWIRRFDAWLDTHSPHTPGLSEYAVSRESIYD